MHWFPVSHKIEYKIVIVCYNAMSGSAPPCAADLFQLYTPSSSLRLSADSRPRSVELRTQKLKSHLVRTQSSNVLTLKPGVGQNIAIHATLTARDFFLAYFYPSGSFICIFSKTSPEFFLLAVANTGSCVGPQNKIGHPAGCSSRVECPWHINRLKKPDL